MSALPNHTIDVADRYGYGRSRAMSVWNSAAHLGWRVVLFSPMDMGQYFKAANLDKKEFVCPWCIGGGAKLWEWAANRQGAIFTLLLRKSSQTGGGDFKDPLPRPDRVAMIDTSDQAQAQQSLQDAIGLAVAAEGMSLKLPSDSIVGRWAEDRVVLIGDYDESGLYDGLVTYRNISQEVVEAWNQFIEFDELQLTYHDDCSCQ